MTTATPDRATTGFDAADAAAAVTLAVRAPSIHNTQPWSWDLEGGVLSLSADRGRQLAVADPDGHSLVVSCGAAVALTRLGLELQGWEVSVRRHPHASDPDLLADLHAVRRRPPDRRDQVRARAAMSRRSERRPFGAGSVTADQIEQLRHAAANDRTFVHFAVRADEALDLAVAVSHADHDLLGDAGYRDEVAAWVRSDPGAADGVPVGSVPRVVAGRPRHTDVPLRDFELGATGDQLIEPDVDERPLLAVVFTDSDRLEDQLAAGEAMVRLMIEADLLGLSTCALSQAVDMLAHRARLRSLMSWAAYPQMIVRIGPRPRGAAAALASRRPLADVLHVHGA